MGADQAWLDDIAGITIESDTVNRYFEIQKQPVVYWKTEQKYYFLHVAKSDETTNYICLTSDEALPLGEDLILEWGEIRLPIYARKVVQTKWFEQHFTTRTTLPLGPLYANEATLFRVWAPTATTLAVNIRNNTYQLFKMDHGIWERKIAGDWDLAPYHYTVHVNGTTRNVNDPYAKAMTANSEQSVVINLSKTNPPQFTTHALPHLEHLQDAVIYETHIRDATSHNESGTKWKGKFLGLAEKNTQTSNGFPTGLNYLKNLGITHLQLMPVQDFARIDENNPASTYNWGYDPLYFQVPEGSYATSATEPASRIIELKTMIQALHEAGISVILDVVFNHVYHQPTSAFEQLVPYYYFRRQPDGQLSNGTGVGNDLATERAMVRKFITDTVHFWLEEYKVDGFRFDLMGIIDLTTMQKISCRVQQENRPIMLLGEGWNLPTALPVEERAITDNAQELPAVRFFNDVFRDTLKGNTFQLSQGYVNGQGQFIERLPYLISGSVFQSRDANAIQHAGQTINYVACHDNLTLRDHLEQTNKEASFEKRKKMQELATGITLLSQGVPFLHAGQEWFRTKQGDSDSYRSGDAVNQLNWKEREKENPSIQFVRTLLKLRNDYPVFRCRTNVEVKQRVHLLEVEPPLFGYALLGVEADFAIFINPTESKKRILLPSSGRWKTAATNHTGKMNVYHYGEYATINPYELAVYQKYKQ